MPYLIMKGMAYPLGKLIIGPIVGLWIESVECKENIPKDKAFIIAANHSSYYDALLVPSIVAPIANKKIHALVNSFYWKPFITRFFLNIWEAIPVYVENDNKKKNQEALGKALSYIRKGESLMIFPEGKRSFDGKLQKAYTGVAKIALKAGIPVLPIGVIDANKVLPRGSIFPRFKRCRVKIGKLMYFEKRKINEKALNDATRRVMQEIARLIGQKYRH